MRWSTFTLVLCLVGSGACSDKPAKPAAPEAQAKSAASATPAAEPASPAAPELAPRTTPPGNVGERRWLNDFEGTIGEAKVTVTLTGEGRRLSGTYFYHRYLTDLQLDGSVDDAGRAELKELDAAGKQTGILRGRFSSPGYDIAAHGGIVGEAGQIDTEDFVGTWSSPDGSKTAPVVLHSARAVSGPPGHRYWVAGFDEDQKVEDFARRLCQAVAQNRRQEFAAMIDYPTWVHVEGRKDEVNIRSQKEFLDQYDRIVTPSFKATVATFVPRAMFAKHTGVMLGNGQVWIAPGPPDPNGRGDVQARIVAINNRLPPHPATAASAAAPAADQGDEHPIDKMVNEVESQYPASRAAADANRKAALLWDKEMNEKYQTLMARLPKPLQEQLRQTQRAWIAFRDEQVKFLDAYYAQQHGDENTMGTMFLWFRARDIMTITKRRVEDLTYSKVDNTFVP